MSYAITKLSFKKAVEVVKKVVLALDGYSLDISELPDQCVFILDKTNVVSVEKEKVGILQILILPKEPPMILYGLSWYNGKKGHKHMNKIMDAVRAAIEAEEVKA